MLSLALLTNNSTAEQIRSASSRAVCDGFPQESPQEYHSFKLVNKLMILKAIVERDLARASGFLKTDLSSLILQSGKKIENDCFSSDKRGEVQKILIILSVFDEKSALTEWAKNKKIEEIFSSAREAFPEYVKEAEERLNEM